MSRGRTTSRRRIQFDAQRNYLERVESMSAQMAGSWRRVATGRAVARLAAIAAVAAVTSMVSSAGNTPVRLVGVTAHGNAVLIEASEPVAYSVSRPDPLTLLVDMRNVDGAAARNDVKRQGTIAGVKVEQTNAVDGRTVARVRLSLARAAEYKVRSSRNMIRVELTPAATTELPAPPPPPMPAVVPETPVASTPASALAPAPAASSAPATAIERIRADKSGASTIVTLSGDGYLAPSRIAESEDAPRRLVLDFPNVSSKAPSQTEVGSALIHKVRVGLNSSQPVVTRVVMEIDGSATYHVQRAGQDGRDLAVIFNRASADTVLVAPPETAASVVQSQIVEPPTPLAPEPPEPQAAAMPAPPTGSPVDPLAALNLVSPPVERATRPAGTAAKTQASAANATPPPAASPQRVQAPPPGPAAPPQNPAAQKSPAQNPPTPRPPATPSAGGPQISANTPQMMSSEGQKQFTGHPISLDFTGGDLRTVLRLFAEVSGLNMIIDPDVQGTVDIVLTDVPWDQALEVILRGNQLDYTVDGTIVRIARIDTLRKEQDSRQALAKAAADAGTLAVRTFPLSYARASQAAPLVRKAALSARGDVQIDERTNMLIITDLPARLETAQELLGALDRPEPQVEIEARIVSTSRDFSRAIGVQWGLNGRVSPALGNTTPLAFPNNGSVGGRLGTQGPEGSDTRANPVDQSGSVVNLPSTLPAAAAIGLALGSVNGAFNLDVALSAMESSGKVRILSQPRVTTQNNVLAEMTQGVQIPVQTVANNTVTVTFKDAALTLKVTPQITAANTVIMQIQLENASPGEEVQGIPSINTQRALTTVQVTDGATTVIGGVMINEERQLMDRVPGLHRVPLLGWLFKRNTNIDDSRELLIFITPRILKG
jgi:type IV pilus assembly protein PilQ